MADDIEATILSTLDSQFGSDRDKGDEDFSFGSNESNESDDTETDDTETDTDDTGGESDAEESPEDETSEDSDESDNADETETEQVEESNDDDEEDEGDDTDKELAALGIKKPKEGQRENRLPYSRMKKIFGNAKKKWDEGVQATIKTHTDKVAAQQEELQRYYATDQVLQNDPAKFMRIIAYFNPAYQQYVDAVERGGGSTQTQTLLDDKSDPRPEPDYEYPDGSKGYTPKGFDAVMAWSARQGARQATKEAQKLIEKELKPFKDERENARQADENYKARQASVRSQIGRAQAAWGDELLAQYKDDIMKECDKDRSVPFDVVVAKVMRKKLSASAGTVREQVVKDLKERPAAASKTVPAGKAKAKKNTEDMSVEEVILEDLRSKGMVK